MRSFTEKDKKKQRKNIPSHNLRVYILYTRSSRRLLKSNNTIIGQLEHECIIVYYNNFCRVKNKIHINIL